jgi:nucleotide-binding universal stress UspA family protein
MATEATMDNERIMVAVDFGATSMRAFEKATELALRLSAQLDIVNVCPPVMLDPKDDPPYIEAAREELTKLANMASAAGLEVRTHLREETVVFGLLEAIDEIAPTLVVVGSHGRRGIQRALLGSISESLAQRSPVPVLIVPSHERKRVAAETAWACADCGHIPGASESTHACARCGATPARWMAATIEAGPVDVAEPAVGEGAAVEGPAIDTQSGAAPFCASPPGSFSRTEANAEIRIRRF